MTQTILQTTQQSIQPINSQSVQQPVQEHRFYSVADFHEIQRRIIEKAKNAISSVFPLEDENFKLVVENINVVPKQLNPQEELAALLADKSFEVPIKGKVKLIDKKTGKVVSAAVKKLASIPYLTWRGTFLVNGSEYGFVNQLRLRPGIYVGFTAAGEPVARVNVARGIGHQIVLNPETGIFYFRIQQANYPLFPILKALGFSDAELRDAFGDEQLYLANAKTLSKYDYVISSLYDTISAKKTAITLDDKAKELREIIYNLELDPKITKYTLGIETNKITPEVIKLTIQKILRASRNDPTAIDDRNHLAFARVYGPEDIIGEQIQRMRGQLIRYFNQIRAKRDVTKLPPGIFDAAIRTALFKSGLGQNLQEINPAENLDTRYRVTRTGAGGIESAEAIPIELRYLHPSHAGVLDPVLTPEGETVGVDNRFTVDTKRDDEGNIYVRLRNAKTGKLEYVPTTDLLNKVITFPGELEREAPYVAAIINNQHVLVPRKEVDYIIPYAKSLYSPLSNLVPLKQNSYGQRVSMGARMIAQALPLVEPEAPLLQTLDPETGKSFYQLYGAEFGAVQAPTDGVVTKVTQDAIYIRGNDDRLYRIWLYRNFPYNRKTFYHEEPLVKAGETVKKGQLIAKSNYVDKEGTLALGRNLRTAYMAWEGYNFEDAAVISESAAKKLTSTQMYQYWGPITPNMTIDKRKFTAIFPLAYSRKTLDKFDENGLPKPGVLIERGEPILLAVERNFGLRASGPVRLFSNASPEWDYDEPGEVVYVHKGKKHYNIVIKHTSPAKVGDKIAGRWGDKHIISLILPDDQMPKDESGQPFELLLNPLGVQGRVNISQLWELLLSKLAKKLGKPILVDDHIGDLYERFGPELEAHGIKEKEIVKTQYGDFLVPTGYRYFHKLHHFAESKLAGRGLGGYTAEETPSKGGESGAKRIGLLEMLGILGHGAYHVARDARVVRGQKNEDYWLRLQLGYDAPSIVDRPLVYDKFIAQLMVLGLNPKEAGSKIEILPLTNSEIKRLVGTRFVRSSDTFKVGENELIPLENGIFDPKITGGFEGTVWSGYELPEPMPNPIAEDILRTLLGLTREQFISYLAGRIDPFGFGSGPEGMRKAVAALNLEAMLKESLDSIKRVKGNLLDFHIKRAKIIKNLLQNKINPADLFWDVVPIIPAIYRPVSFSIFSGIPLISDLNYLYKSVIDTAQTVAELKREKILDPEDRLQLYNALKALAGFAEPVNPKLKAQNVQGALKLVIGESPKEGVVQRKLLGATVNLVGRATIIPNPNMSVDEVKIPEDAAWEIYKPYIIRRLIRKGIPVTRALEMVNERKPDAEKALHEEMKERPVIISRAPVLWKFGVMAAFPKITKNKTLEIHPLTVVHFGADFDGDAMNFHVPSDPKAVAEAKEKMLPSKVLFGLTRFQPMLVPTMEYLGGLYYLSNIKHGVGTPRRFRNLSELIAALLAKQLDPHQNVIVESDKLEGD